MMLAKQVYRLYIACCMFHLAFSDVTSKVFKHDDSVNGRVCPNIQRSFTKKADRIMVCSFHCSLDPSCKSLFYGQTSRTCYGCSDVYTALSTLGNESVETVYYTEKEIDVGPLQVRLSNDSGYADRGRVEVLYNGTWGTVCDDGWLNFLEGHELNNIKVLCGMFGYSNGTILPKNSYPMVNASGVRTWLDNFTCNGHETTIFDCGHNGFGEENCSHDEDLSVHCHN